MLAKNINAESNYGIAVTDGGCTIVMYFAVTLHDKHNTVQGVIRA